MPYDIETDCRHSGPSDDPGNGTTSRHSATDAADTMLPLPPSDAPNGTDTTLKDSGATTNDPRTDAEHGETSSKNTIAQESDVGTNSNDTGTTANGPEPGSTNPESSAKNTVNMQTVPPKEQAVFNERKLGADKTKRLDDQPKRRPTKCGCLCEPNCNCKCTCAHKGHCVCRSPCEGKCGTRVSRNLVVSLDGTSNQFGPNVSGPLNGCGPFFTHALSEHQCRCASQSSAP
jgi:hypothetical protein